MRTLIITEFITLDGVIDSPGGGDHPHGGWTFQDIEFDEAAYEIKGTEQQEAGALMVGRQSWQEFHEIWPTMGEVFPLYNQMPKYVVSTTLEEQTVADSPWQPMTVLRSVEDVAKLKEGAWRPDHRARQCHAGAVAGHGRARGSLSPAGLPGDPRQRQAALRRRWREGQAESRGFADVRQRHHQVGA